MGRALPKLDMMRSVELHFHLLPGVASLRTALSAAGIPLEVRCGGELDAAVAGALTRRELDTIAQGPRGARWLLLETPFEGISPVLGEVADELRACGFGIVLAHPERSADVIHDGATGVMREVAAGATLQVTAGSLLGDHGPEARAAAWRLVTCNLPLLVSSDAHGPTRPPALTDARRVLAARLGDQRARQLCVRIPRRLVARGLRHDLLVAA